MKSVQQQKARDYYLSGEKSQKEVAQLLSISDKTLYLWIKQNAWDQLKKAAYEAPAIMVDNMCSQLVELQAHIASRNQGQRFPSVQEAEITRKLITCMLKLKDYPSKGSFMQMMTSFVSYTRKFDPKLAMDIKKNTEKFFYSDKSGYAPYQVEHDTIYEPDIDMEDNGECHPADTIGCTLQSEAVSNEMIAEKSGNYSEGTAIVNAAVTEAGEGIHDVSVCQTGNFIQQEVPEILTSDDVQSGGLEPQVSPAVEKENSDWGGNQLENPSHYQNPPPNDNLYPEIIPQVPIMPSRNRYELHTIIHYNKNSY